MRFSKRQIFLFGMPAILVGMITSSILGYMGIYITSQAIQAGTITEPYVGVLASFWDAYSDYVPLLFVMAMGAWFVKSVEWVRGGEV